MASVPSPGAAASLPSTPLGGRCLGQRLIADRVRPYDGPQGSPSRPAKTGQSRRVALASWPVPVGKRAHRIAPGLQQAIMTNGGPTRWCPSAWRWLLWQNGAGHRFPVIQKTTPGTRTKVRPRFLRWTLASTPVPPARCSVGWRLVGTARLAGETPAPRAEMPRPTTGSRSVGPDLQNVVVVLTEEHYIG